MDYGVYYSVTYFYNQSLNMIALSKTRMFCLADDKITTQFQMTIDKHTDY